MPIYTKKGDKGTSSVLNGRRLSKAASIFEALGTVDEVNSYLGLAASFLEEQYLKNKVTQVQKMLFKLGSIMAGARMSIPKMTVTKYEKEIDAWTRLMPKLTNFILPGGSKAAATLFIARTVVRRLERLLVKLNDEKRLKPNILVFINRLSDYLFTLGRYINFREGTTETPWRGPKACPPKSRSMSRERLPAGKVGIVPKGEC